MTVDWRDRAACRDIPDPDELFFPTASEGTLLGDEARSFAVAICAGCPVREVCLAFALDTRQDEGVWGGKVESQRRVLLGLGVRRHVRTRPDPAEPVPV